MEFAKYYDVTKRYNELKSSGTVEQDTEYYKMYVCNDTNSFWVCRLMKGYDSEYENDPDSFLLERNEINKYDIFDYMFENNLCKEFKLNKYSMSNKIDELPLQLVVDSVLKYDSEEEYENWDCESSYDEGELIEMIDGGYGIVEL